MENQKYNRRFVEYKSGNSAGLKTKYMEQKTSVLDQATSNENWQPPKSNAVTVTPIQLENIKGEKLLYVRIETKKGKVNISIGEKNHNALIEILK